MKYLIKAKCNDCDFSDNYDKVYEHCKKTKHGGYGSHLWSSDESGRNRCNMTLDKTDTIKAILQGSMEDILDNFFDYDKGTYKNIFSYWLDMFAIEKIPYQIEGDDIDDVINSLKNGEIKNNVKEHLMKLGEVVTNSSLKVNN